MKFDGVRATELFAKLGDPTFAGAHGEARVADFVAAQLEQSGWVVERALVEGSAFPLRWAPWAGWLGYGALVAAAYVLLLGRNARTGFLAVLILVPAHFWLRAVLRNQIGWGRRMPPLEHAPLVLARAPGGSGAPVRVVFQATLGGLRLDHFHALWLSRTRVMFLHLGFVLTASLTVLSRLFGRPVAQVVGLWLASAFLVLITFAILGIFSCEIRAAHSADGSFRVDRRGLTLLFEMARCWPRSGSRPIEVIFVAAGGQRLNDASARAVVHRLESEWPRKPSLLLLFIVPGFGGEHSLVPIASSFPGTSDLANEAARSLWIPIRGHDPWARWVYWPLKRNIGTMEVIALCGAHAGSAADSSFSPQALDHAAQLATEIALRWAKKTQREKKT
jgi:hypothetical protein